MLYVTYSSKKTGKKTFEVRTKVEDRRGNCLLNLNSVGSYWESRMPFFFLDLLMEEKDVKEK